MSRQHTAMNHSKSYEALKRIVQEFANNSTKGQEAMQTGRVEAGAAAPTTAWPPSVAETSEDSWEEYGAINAMGSQQCWTCKGLGHVSQVPMAKARPRAHTNGTRATTTGTRAATTGCTRELERRTPSSHGTVKGYQKGVGKSGGKGPLLWQVLHLRWRSLRTRLPQRCMKRRIQGTGRLGDLERAATGRTRHVFLPSLREAPPKHAGPQRVSGELRKKIGNELQQQGWTSTNGRRSTGACRTTSKRTGWRMGGESQQEEPEEPEAEGARTGRTDASTGFTGYTSAAILTENVLDDRARPREGSQR